MAFVRTAKGTASAKTSGTTLTVSSVSIKAFSVCLVGVTYASTTVHPVVKFGQRELKLIIGTRISNAGMTTALYKATIRETKTKDLTLTWGSAIAARTCFVSEIDHAGPKDVENKQTNTSSTSPGTGTAVTTLESNTFHIAAFGSKGPSSDEPGTINLGHASGQRAGTVGAPPVSNVTIHETYEELTASGDCRATKTDATARDWANSIVALDAENLSRVGITPGDIATIEAKFETLSKDFGDAVFKFNDTTGCWEVFDTTAAMGSAVADSCDFWE